MAGRIEPLQESQVPALSEFLRGGFCPPGSYCAFAEPEVLRWKYLDARGSFLGPRSFVVLDNGRILAHAGVCPTEFVVPGSAPVPAVHIIDWLSSDEAGSYGALLMMRAFGLAPVAYALGCTPAAARVLLRLGYQIVSEAPLYHRVLNRHKLAVWHELHGTQTLARAIALLGADLVQSFRPAKRPGSLKIRQVNTFGSEVDEICARANRQYACTSRTPALLNHYLHFPLRTLTGFIFEDQHVRGFALLSIVQKPHIRLARIVDCVTDSAEASLWTEATSLLLAEATRHKPDLVSCFGTTDIMAQALRANGFFRRGRIPFYLRDPKNLTPRTAPLHLTHLEADLAYI